MPVYKKIHLFSIKKNVSIIYYAFPFQNERIYWCDSANDKIESATYDGGSRTKVLSADPKSHLHSPLIDKGMLYWIDMYVNALCSLKNS